MPTVQNPTETEVREAAAVFFDDFEKVMTFHDQIQAMAQYRGRNNTFDQGFSSIVDRQSRLMFGLRDLYADTYEWLTPPQRSLLYKWIVSATGELREIKAGFGQLGIAPIIIIAGIAITAATAGALVAWHREISVQAQALANQAELIPLVAEGKIPSDVLRPLQPTTIASSLTAIARAALLIAAGYLAWQLYQQWRKT